MVLRRIDPLSAGKFLGVLYALLGLLMGALFTLASLLGAVAAAQRGGNGAAGMLLGVGAIVILPVLYGFAGFVGGLIGALLYNVVASLVGGIEIDLERSGQGLIE